MPLFYFGWKSQFFIFVDSETIVAGVLARLILSLTFIKLLQKKGDRDWIFLYLMSFFQVLLAAGLSISAFYIASLILYLLSIICAIILFEIRKTSKVIALKNKVIEESLFVNNLANKSKGLSVRIPGISLSLIFLIVGFALPMFFLIPRVGGAGIGGIQNNVSANTGFSESVRLGEIGKIQQNEQVVMRVRLEKRDENFNLLRWRGIALDTFDNHGWSKSNNFKERYLDDGRGYFQINYANSRENRAVQTFYLEPIDTNILFGLSQPLLIQGNFPVIYKDSENSINYAGNSSERISYRIISDTTLPNAQALRRDNGNYLPAHEKYLQLPARFDERISQLAKNISENSFNRYDKAKAVESYLQNNFGYTLELKPGGEEPLAEFLFTYREGHCEYFATAMAVMLRTQGIATRVVNGFQPGEYNETADVYVVKQRNAHSWVEVYFPKENVWVPFDPTPFAGQSLESNASTGIIGKFNNYVEALETFWIQYFVAFDNQEQRSLFRSVKNGFTDYQAKTSSWLGDKQNQLNEWWKEVRGDKGLETSIKAAGYGVAYLIAVILSIILLVWLYRKIIKMQIWQRIFIWLKRKNEATIVEFYERMQTVLASKGFRREPHQTPLEFAFALKMPEAVRITEKYNRVRFGEKNLSNDEANEIENWLENLKNSSL
jgi:transglutaminase-like putative cysteine protease